jgi:hypothetical protein
MIRIICDIQMCSGLFRIYVNSYVDLDIHTALYIVDPIYNHIHLYAVRASAAIGHLH